MALSLLCARIIVKKLGPREYGGSGLQGTGGGYFGIRDGFVICFVNFFVRLVFGFLLNLVFG